ncbi:MAG: 1-acyl-sn-glycerol-3-phosphate acyltransferase [Lewinellaceae bacterium]|nr:1-acyl-sn-glycerol-3-phosphate acyltransferase [Lewinellaceae bacterium]
MNIRLRDPFGNILPFKRLLTGILGLATYSGLNIVNRTKVEGAHYLLDLPKNNVLFVSNHETYFADVFAMYHIFSSVKWRFRNINIPIYLLFPRVKSYYIAAEETMKKGWLPRLFSYAGAVTVKRNWRQAGQEVTRGADVQAPTKIVKALSFGWVITFPQGTTELGAPVRKGTAHLIKTLKPTVVPVYIEGFREAFDKKGLRIRNRGSKLLVRFSEPIQFDDDITVASIQEFLEGHILGEAAGKTM